MPPISFSKPAGLLTCASVLLLNCGCGSDSQPADAPPTAPQITRKKPDKAPESGPYSIARVTRGDLSASISTHGRFFDWSEIQPESVGAKVEGRIKSFGPDPDRPGKAIELNSRVEKGGVLVTIDPAPFVAEAGKAKVEIAKFVPALENAQAKLKQAETDWDQVKQRKARNAISDRDFAIAEIKYEAARMLVVSASKELTEAQAELKEAEDRIANCIVRAPFDGLVIHWEFKPDRTLEVFEFEAPVCLIAKDLRKPKVWVALHFLEFPKVRAGQKVRFQFDGQPGEPFLGEIAEVGGDRVLYSKTATFYPLLMTVKGAHGKSLYDKFARFDIELGKRKNILRVPNLALYWEAPPAQIAPGSPAIERDTDSFGMVKYGAWSYVWVPAGKFVRPVKVRVGLTDDKLTEILASDLKEGDAVVVGPFPDVVLPAGAAPAAGESSK